MAPSFWTSVLPAGSSVVTLPLRPSTRTVLPLTEYLTPAGTGIGFLPIRDISESFERLASREADFCHLRSTAACGSRLAAGVTQNQTSVCDYQTSQRISPPTPSRRA